MKTPLLIVLAVLAISSVESQRDRGWGKDWHPGPPPWHHRGPHGFHGGPHGFHGGPHGFHGGPLGFHKEPHGYHKYNDDDDSKEGSEENSNEIGKNKDDCNCGNYTNENNGKVPSPTTSLPLPPPTTSLPLPPPPPFRKDISDDPEQAFQDLASEVIENDQKYSKYCQKNTITGVKEIYGMDNYKLIIPLGDNDPDNVLVKVKHRVLYVHFETPEINARWSADSENNFSYLKTLPSFLDVSRITWDIKDVNLEITVPYKVLLNKEIPTGCATEVDTRVITVPHEGEAGDSNDDSKLVHHNDEEVTEKPAIDKDMLDKIFGNRYVA